MDGEVKVVCNVKVAPFLETFSFSTMSDFNFVLIKSMIFKGGFSIPPFHHTPSTENLAEKVIYLCIVVSNNQGSTKQETCRELKAI